MNSLYSFSEGPNRGLSSVIELANNAKELLVASDDGRLQRLELQKPPEGSSEGAVYILSDVCSAPTVPIKWEGEVHLGADCDVVLAPARYPGSSLPIGMIGMVRNK